MSSSPLQLVLLMFAVTSIALTHSASTGKSECDPSTSAGCGLRHLHQYYQELDCKPVQEAGSCCPARYDCGHFDTRDKSQCYFRGKALDIKPEMGELVPGSCLASCFCRQTKEAGAVATLTCAHIECPTLFNPSIIPPGCVATYSDDKCCSDGILCPQNVTETTTKCEYKGKTYLEGQKFYPEEAPCKTCTCRSGFDGTLEGPWCKAVTCGFELHYADRIAKGCAPVFLDKAQCCPIEWRCPEEDDVVVAAATSKKPEEASADPAATCKWGALTLQKGESLNAPKEDRFCQRCRCDLPPHVTCERSSSDCQQLPVAPVAVPTPGEAPAAGIAPTPAVDEAKIRPVRAEPKDPCAAMRCVGKCVVNADGLGQCAPSQ